MAESPEHEIIARLQEDVRSYRDNNQRMSAELAQARAQRDDMLKAGVRAAERADGIINKLEGYIDQIAAFAEQLIQTRVKSAQERDGLRDGLSELLPLRLNAAGEEKPRRMRPDGA